MTTPAFLEQVQSLSPVTSGDEILSFGDIAAECAAGSAAGGGTNTTEATPRAVACVVPELIRLRFSGKDRASFLHNFCTNDIKGLPAGSACEAIFTNVKARVLGHGYILAAATTHELWMLPGDATALYEHLDRYISAEDVTIERVPADFTCLLLSGDVGEALAEWDLSLPEPDSKMLGSQLDTDVCMLQLNWQQPSMLFGLSDAAVPRIWPTVVAKLTPAGRETLEYLRIAETFPRVGVDLTSDNLAVEAGRLNAISYVKGCYLGQEPIARIDAMGRVNRTLQTVVVGEETTEQDTRNQLTSISHKDCPQRTGIAMLSPKQTDDCLPARTQDERVVTVTRVETPQFRHHQLQFC